ncbi:hypothetical protein KAM622c_41630 [Klebsiella quasipneumoniae subsp. quasipneumoniae]|nr:hypothetical protein KAM622c_41630 [Klebsiella quasipneumoniae subsp. quasipneumoniae]
MRIGGGDNLPLGTDNPAITAVMMTVAVGADPVTTSDVGLVLNRAGDQQLTLIKYAYANAQPGSTKQAGNRKVMRLQRRSELKMISARLVVGLLMSVEQK